MANAAQTHPFGDLVRTWRHERKLSQLKLALEAGISQRHLSFLESGRTRPSPEMVLRLCNSLDIPLRGRNELLMAAGFAPRYSDKGLDSLAAEPVRRALELMLSQQEPYPAVVVDRNWYVILANEASTRLFGYFAASVNPLELFPDGRPNSLRFTFHPRGLRPAISNWEEAGEALLSRVRGELRLSPDNTVLRELFDELSEEGAESFSQRPLVKDVLPVVTLELQKGQQTASLFSTITTLGTPLDATLQELRIELFFPGDDETVRFAEDLGSRARTAEN